jgi:hypothetical protein
LVSVAVLCPPDAPPLRSTARDYRQLALVHPHVVPLLVTRPLGTSLGLRPLGMRRLEALQVR